MSSFEKLKVDSLIQSGQTTEAFAQIRGFLKENPRDLEGNLAMARLLAKTGRDEEARHYFRNSIRINPKHKPSYVQLGSYLESKNDSIALKRFIDSGRQFLPDLGFLYNNLLAVLHRMGKENEVIEFHKSIYKYEPNNERNILILASILEKMHNQESVNWFKKLLTVDSRYKPLAAVKVAYYRLTNGAWDDFEKLEKQLVKEVDNWVEDDQLDYNIPLYQLMHFRFPRQLLFKAACKNSKLISANIEPFKHSQERIKARRIRVGYLSPKVSNHSNMLLYSGIFQCHDRGKFHISMFAMTQRNDEANRLIRKSVDYYLDCSGLKSVDVANKIREQGIDILFMTGAHMEGVRMDIPACKPAPIIINGEGYNESTGAEFIDYAIIDDEIATGETPEVYSEKLIKVHPTAALNSELISLGNQPILTRASQGLPGNKFVFGCLSLPRKLHPSVFPLWIEILKASPNTVLWLFFGRNPEIKQATQELFSRNGVDPERVFWAPRVGLKESHARYALIDLMLDTPVYNSHTTAIESLRMGTPILTLRGDTHVSRYCSSILRAADLNELVTDNSESYVRKAISISQIPDEFKTLKAKVVQRHGLLFDEKLHARKLDTLFEKVWQNYVAGYPPKEFDIN